ncbi:hypothetical protein [Marinobacter sp. AL4B]|uniref:hypothetical protein n=1 Tax=Marinobacter sp. AL4B TaxID=2871173 RepID=UPI001CAA4FDD|nr:hypothetical protein [Marinobacter sp. AL4B]MBZ0332623.1 hypothetical protein [Marinobacter sp. AL4B]
MQYLRDTLFQQVDVGHGITAFKRTDWPNEDRESGSWKEAIANMLHGEQPKASVPWSKGAYSPVILKVNALKYSSQRVRALLGIQRHGRYEWATAEIHTALQMQGKPYIPKLYAYGWSKTRFGLPDRIFSITEFLSETKSVEEIARDEESSEIALRLALDTFRQAIDDGLLHLDPWAGNCLISDDQKKCWLVDLEFSKLNSQAPIEHTLGFCCGFFYKGSITKRFTPLEYRGFVADWFSQALPNRNLQLFIEKMDFYMNNHVKRKRRFAAF